MKKQLALGMAVVLGATSLAACSTSQPAATEAATEAAAEAAESAEETEAAAEETEEIFSESVEERLRRLKSRIADEETAGEHRT